VGGLQVGSGMANLVVVIPSSSGQFFKRQRVGILGVEDVVILFS